MRILLILIISFNLYATDVNSSDKSFKDLNTSLQNYEKLLKELQDENDSVEHIKLQKSMVYKLINITKFYKPKEYKTSKITKIISQEDFIELIDKFISYKYEVSIKQKEIESVKEKLKLIKENISKIDKNSPHLLTYQLQENFYNITLQRIESSINDIQEEIIKEIRIFNMAYEKLTLESVKALVELKKLEEEYQKVSHSILENNIEQDRLFILRGSKNQKTIETLNRLYSQKDDILKNMIIQNLILQLYYLKLKSDKAFEYQKKISELIEKLSSQKELAKESIRDIISPLVSQKLGATKVIAEKTKQSLWDIAKMFWELLNKELFSINNKPMSTISIVLTFFILIIGLTIGKIYKANIQRANHIFVNISPSTQTILSNIGYYIILLISFFILLKTIGLDLSSFALIAGALSVGIGFGLQNVISNLVSGIILMFEKSIKLGDFIEINDEFMGKVTDIKMRSTTIVTNDNIEIIVPNQMFIQNNVINWTHTNSVRRFRIPFGVAYGTSVSKVKEAVLKALSESNIEHIRSTLPHRKARVIMTSMNNSSVDFELFVWIEGDKAITPARTTSEFLILIYNALYDNNIEIPFPQLDLHIKDSNL